MSSHPTRAALASRRALCTGKKSEEAPPTHPPLGAGPPTDAAGRAAAKALFALASHRSRPAPRRRIPCTAHGSQTNPVPLSPPPLVALLLQLAALVRMPAPVSVRSAQSKCPHQGRLCSSSAGGPVDLESVGNGGWGAVLRLACLLRLPRWAFRNGVQLGRPQVCAEGFIAGSPSRACSVRAKALSSAGRPDRARLPRAHNTGPDCAGPFCRPVGRRE